MASIADLARIRSFVARELETISSYESMAADAEDGAVKQLLLHAATEEKEHVAEGLRLLNALDGEQGTRQGLHADTLLAGGTAVAGVMETSTRGVTILDPSASSHALTVGSLRRSG